MGFAIPKPKIHIEGLVQNPLDSIIQSRKLHIIPHPDKQHIVFFIQDGKGREIASCQIPREAAKQVVVDLVKMLGGTIKSL